MKLYFAPLEGITDHIYRRLHRRYFPGVDMYFTPFLSPTQNHIFPPRELRQIAPENNAGVPLTPQLLTKDAGDFLWAANALADMGYEEVNLNVGCPSGTVTAKGKGAGLLADLDSLRRLLDGIFAAVPMKVSVKTRLGVRDPAEFGPILDIYNDYPISELIIHARTAKEMYEGPVHPDAFGGPTSAMNRMKAIWTLMLGSFEGGEAYAKRLGKARKGPEMRALTEEICAGLPLARPSADSKF